jgi:hypothetical protein
MVTRMPTRVDRRPRREHGRPRRAFLSYGERRWQRHLGKTRWSTWVTAQPGGSMAKVTYEKEITALLVIDPYNDFISQGGKIWDHIRVVAEANG